ncbi:MAG: DUF4435 domain-containing protein [Muribaculaceae bacterium]|nr:DUF4435 domain-containing protein [Muribaculaceae bacterium]
MSNSIQAAVSAKPESRQKQIYRSNVRQLLSHPDSNLKPLVLVEGPYDVKFYKECLGSSDWRFKDLGGCPHVEEFLNDFVPNYGVKVCGIIDSDFMRLDHDIEIFRPDLKAPNLFVTDHHDWENWVITEPNVKAFWELRVNTTKYTYSPTLLDDVKAGIENLAWLWWYHCREVHRATVAGEVNHSGLNISGCKTEHLWGKDLKEVYDYLLSLPLPAVDTITLSLTDFKNFVLANKDVTDPKQLYRGHDLCDAIQYRIKQLAKPNPQLKKNDFANYLIEFGDKTEFHSSQLKSDLTSFLTQFQTSVRP